MARKRGRGSVRLHANGWEASIRLDGRRIYGPRFEKESEAWEWIANTKSDHVRGILGKPADKPVEPPAPPITFGNLARLLAAHKQNAARKPWRPGTARFVREHLKATILPAFENRLACEITPEELQAWLDSQHGRPCRGNRKGAISTETVRKIESILSMVFRYGIKIGKLTTNPLAGIERTPAQSDTGTRARVFQPEELRAILTAAPRGRLRSFFTVLALTGLRRSEAFRMRWDWVDFDARVLRVKLAKKGSSEVPMSHRVISALMELAPPPAPLPGVVAGLVFPGFPRTGRRGSRGDNQKQLTDMRRPLAEVLAAAGVDPTGVGLHTFRRTYLTLIENCLPASKFSHVVALARHARNAQGMTARYLLPSMEELHEDLVQLERIVFTGPKLVLLAGNWR